MSVTLAFPNDMNENERDSENENMASESTTTNKEENLPHPTSSPPNSKTSRHHLKHTDTVDRISDTAHSVFTFIASKGKKARQVCKSVTEKKDATDSSPSNGTHSTADAADRRDRGGAAGSEKHSATDDDTSKRQPEREQMGRENRRMISHRNTSEEDRSVIENDNVQSTTESEDPTASVSTEGDASFEKPGIVSYLRSMYSTFTRDILLSLFCFSWTAYLLYKHREQITADQIPSTAALTWTVLSFFMGMCASSLLKCGDPREISDDDQRVESVCLHESVFRKSFLSTAAREKNNPSRKNHFAASEFYSGLRNRFAALRMSSIPKAPLTSFRTALQKRVHSRGGSDEESWTAGRHVPVDGFLRAHLRKTPHFYKKSKRSVGFDSTGSLRREGSVADDENPKPLGAVEGESPQTVMEDAVPVCTLRGLDSFVGDDPAEEIWKHLLLNRCGLRDVPTFIINVMVPWGNFVIYMELPKWVKRFDDIVEEDQDTEDTKALKRFLKGSDKYRSLRLKALPCVVEAPLPIRMMAPAKEVFAIQSSILNLKWYQRDEETNSRGKVRAAVLEVDMDIVTTNFTRKVFTLLGRYMHKVVVDLAIIVDGPQDEEEEAKEPSTCLGLFRLNRFEIENSPSLPPPTKDEDILRASLLSKQRLGYDPTTTFDD